MSSNTRLKSVIKYHLSEVKMSIVIFYGIMAAITLLIGFVVVSNSGSMGGGEMASFIFLFIIGLNSFKNNYLYLSTNGISRKTQFYGFVLSAAIVCLAMSAIDIIYSSILSEFVEYKSMFQQLYDAWSVDSKISMILIGFLYGSVLYFFTMMSGYFITTLYYKMNKFLKIIVSIVVPASIFIVIPTIDAVYTKGKLTAWLQNVSKMLGGFENGQNPLMGTLSLAVGAVIAVVLSYLLVRRATIKE